MYLHPSYEIVSGLDRFLQRHRFIHAGAEHERGLPAHHLRPVPVTVSLGNAGLPALQRVARLLVRRWSNAVLLLLLLLQVSEDGLGQEVRVVVVLI